MTASILRKPPPHSYLLTMVLIAVLCLSACGSGGGSSAKEQHQDQQSSPQTEPISEPQSKALADNNLTSDQRIQLHHNYTLHIALDDSYLLGDRLFLKVYNTAATTLFLAEIDGSQEAISLTLNLPAGTNTLYYELFGNTQSTALNRREVQL